MRKRLLDSAQFLKDVSQHKMTVLMDDGLYRHLRFVSSGEPAWNQWFEIITWPGRLAYSGDMGTYVFARLDDMFEFFRADQRSYDKMYINPGYWAEKLQAVDIRGSVGDYQEFSPERFTEYVQGDLEEWLRECSLDKEGERQLREAVGVVLESADCGKEEAFRTVCNFREEIGGQTFMFHDAWEWNVSEYTRRYLWCCYALVWAIRQYDERADATGTPAV